ncbi:MAG TPA: hypothetical protein VF479_05195 [Pseudolysinimonas sp.]
MTAPWYRTRLFLLVVAVVALILFDIYFWVSAVPKPEYIAPGGWNSDSSRIDQAYAIWYALVAAVPVLIVLALLGPVVRPPARWTRRAAAVLLLLAIEVAGFVILAHVGPYPLAGLA